MAARVSAAVAFEWPKETRTPRLVACAASSTAPGNSGANGHQAHVAMGSVDQAIEGGDVGCQQMFGRLHSALFVREERAFKVDAEWPCTPGLRELGDFVGQAVERAKSGIERRGDCGGEIGAGSTRSEKRADGIERIGRGFHDVVTGSAVDMHVEKCRAEGGAGKVEHLGSGRQLRRIARGDGVDLAVFNKDQGMLVEAGTVPESFCGHYRLHGYPLLQVSAEDARAAWDERLSSKCNAQARLVCYCFAMRNSALFLVAGGLLLVGVQTNGAQTIDLPTSKQLIEPVPGNPQRLNSLPMSMAISPDGRYVVTVNAGYGTYESKYEQSLAVFDTQTGTLTDFPDDRTPLRAKQTLYSGLAFSRDGRHVYASIGSETDPEGKLPPFRGLADTGSGIVVYRFAEGKIEPERLIHLPLDTLASGHTTKLIGEVDGDKGVPFPAAIAVVEAGGAEKLLVAENLTDDVLLIDPATGNIEHRFDLTESNAVPSTYPIALQISKDGRRAFVALWNASEIVELDLEKRCGWAQAGVAETGESRQAGNASVRICAERRRQDALRGAGESRCCGGGECGRGAVCGQGIL